MKQDDPSHTHPSSNNGNNTTTTTNNNNKHIAPSSPNRRREQQREQALSSYRNDRIKKAYGAPCPYKQSPAITDYSRPMLMHTSTDHPHDQVREYYAPISKRHPQRQQQHYSSYEDVILGGVRPVSASRLQFNDSEFLGIHSSDINGTANTDYSDYADSGGRPLRPVTSSGAHASPKHPSSSAHRPQPHQQSPRRLILTDLREAGDGRGDSSSCYYRLDPDQQHQQHMSAGGGGLEDNIYTDGGSVVQEQRAVLAIRCEQ